MEEMTKFRPTMISDGGLNFIIPACFLKPAEDFLDRFFLCTKILDFSKVYVQSEKSVSIRIDLYKSQFVTG